MTERLEGVVERELNSKVDPLDETSRASDATGLGGRAAAPLSSLLPLPFPLRSEPSEMSKPVLVSPTSLAAALDMNASRAMTSCLISLSRIRRNGSALGHIAAYRTNASSAR